jgi:formylglycine-generating enzyme required for sulfatase activity
MKLAIGVAALGICLVAQAAAPAIANIAMVPRLTIQSDIGSTNEIQYATSLNQTNWTALADVVVTQSPFTYADINAPPAPQRFYRVVALNQTPSAAPTNMVLIPAGSFTMGDALDGVSFFLPLHTVQVSAFYMDKYLVTTTLWNDVYNWAISQGYVFKYGALRKAKNHPVYALTWYDCVKWCNARSEKEGRRPAYYTDPDQTAVYRTAGDVEPYVNWNSGYRLPTEAEWEKAARGGLEGKRFPWGNTISWSQANYNAQPALWFYDVNPSAGTNPAFNDGVAPFLSPVGSFPANGYGLYDMAGNVFQWCWDLLDNYASGAQTDPHGPGTPGPDPYRVLRGGSCGKPYGGDSDQAPYCRSAHRHGAGPGWAPGGDFWIGFRCVLPPS